MHAPLLFDMSLSKHDDIFNLDCFAATCLSPYCLRIFPDMGWHRRCGRKLWRWPELVNRRLQRRGGQSAV